MLIYVDHRVIEMRLQRWLDREPKPRTNKILLSCVKIITITEADNKVKNVKDLKIRKCDSGRTKEISFEKTPIEA